MPTITARNAAQQDFLPLMRELVRTYQAFTAYDAALHRAHDTGLTISQADVIFTLGNTDGMTCSEVGDRTLITKGTLTGVIDRLVDKGLVARNRMPDDARCIRLSLTPAGVAMFESVFPKHIAAIKSRFDRMPKEHREQLRRSLAELRAVF